MSNADHRKMVALIRKKDAEGVEQLVREHILRGQAAVLKEFDKQKKDVRNGKKKDSNPHCQTGSRWP